MWRTDPLQMFAAVALDLLLGDPRGWPHIARIAGFFAMRFEYWITTIFGRTIFSGLLLWITVCGAVLGVFSILYLLLFYVNSILSAGFWEPSSFTRQSLLVIFMDMSCELLIPSLRGNLGQARQNLAMIVGRDTKTLDEVEVNRAGIESVAESLTDGILAPLFWALIAGPAGALIYRVANTLDSMVGHRNEKYECVGKASARIDDALSWIPARLTALMFLLWRPSLSWNKIKIEARAHASPNAGWGEAAMAYALNVRLGGDNWYQGERVSGPIFNSNGHAPQLKNLQESLNWMWKITGLFSALCIIALVLWKCLWKYTYAS